jgi:pSer/pThr/pTyr-binding forkhead associated (FHA) protein
MAKLQFSLDGNSLGEFELNKERTTIGRRPANDIHIDNLAVSGEHAVITTIGNDSFLEDMNSTNGTLVNNKPIKKHVLHHNDIIEFGKYQLLYVNQAQANMPPNHGGFENTVVLRPTRLTVAEAETAKKSEEKLAEEKPAEAMPADEKAAESNAESAPPEVVKSPVENAPKMGRLKILTGTNSGREMVLNKALTTLGKPGAQVAVITKRPNGYFITHVEGEHLPSINGLKISPQAYALSEHDIIDIAGLKMEFFLA